MDENSLMQHFFRIRRELKDQQKIYQKCSEKLSSITKKDSGGLTLFKTDTDIKISLLRKQSVFIVYQISKQNGFSRVDLHGLSLQESQETVITILDQIMRHLTSSNAKKFNIEIITGKGLHSQGEAVLHPRIKEFLISQGYQAKSSSDNGKIDVIIKA